MINNTGKNIFSILFQTFCSLLEQNNYYWRMNAGKYNLETYFTESILFKYDIWFEHYTSSTSYKRHKISQYTDTGVVF